VAPSLNTDQHQELSQGGNYIDKMEIYEEVNKGCAFGG